MLNNEEEAEDDLSDLFADAAAPLPQPLPDAVEHESPKFFNEHEEAEEPCARRRALPDPGQPTQKQIDEHNLDHMPYRSWCRECVQGRGRGEPHKSSGTRDAEVPTFTFDYLRWRRRTWMCARSSVTRMKCWSKCW